MCVNVGCTAGIALAEMVLGKIRPVVAHNHEAEVNMLVQGCVRQVQGCVRQVQGNSLPYLQEVEIVKEKMDVTPADTHT